MKIFFRMPLNILLVLKIMFLSLQHVNLLTNPVLYPILPYIPDPMSTHPVVVQSRVQHSPVIPQPQYNDELISSTPQNPPTPIVSNPDQFVNPASTPHPIHPMRTRAKCGIYEPNTHYTLISSMSSPISPIPKSY